jgi:cyclopropane-fatty-acyl-phospholipid synthase
VAAVDESSRLAGAEQPLAGDGAPAAVPEALAAVMTRAGVSCDIVLPDGRVAHFGDAPAAFTMHFKTQRALARPPTEYSWGRAYINGEIDVDGDMLALLGLRDALRFGTPNGQVMRFLYELFMRPPTAVNRKAINRHYTLGDDFYLTFIDTRYRFYSHCLFQSDTESLEEAAEHKLESMWNALGLEPGMRLLDVGGGWGGVAEYCGARGVEVTSLTLVEDSAVYIRELVAEKDLGAHVVVQDVLDYEPAEPFDHAVIYGVIEHIPNYARLSDRMWAAIKPGGRLYIDASAVKEKYAISPITRRYTWSGHHSFLVLQDIVRELLFHGFEIVETRRETHDYELTIWHWAQRLDDARDALLARWGEDTYRAFHVFLWGGCHAFRTNRLQAYHLVAERRSDCGPRPSVARRTAGFIGSLR